MKRALLLVFLLFTTFVFSQGKVFWQKESPANRTLVKTSRSHLPTKQTYSLDIEGIKAVLQQAPVRGEFTGISKVIIAFPNHEGVMENYRIMEAPVMHPELMAKYPGIKSYAGQGVEDPTARIRFSVSPLGLQSMRLSGNSEASFIEPYTNDLTQYTVYKRSDKAPTYDAFECEVQAAADNQLSGDSSFNKNADDGILRTYRLAISATGEYTQYHGGTKALALAAMNTTMTRVNGIYETDFNVTMVLIANTDDVIYTNSATDPYGSTTSGYNSELQSTLTSVIGEANYDIGHLFANLQNNGNAGCIGCVCVNNQKGSGWTSHTVPEGDPFDVDYVAHEMGHQFGGNHTFTFSNEGTGVQMEPGSGSTIMGYAGITGATDVQSNSDPYFHSVSIQQITDYIKTTSCQTNTSTGNSVPVVNAGPDYTIPKGTPFVLDGSATDADTGDVLTYCWEQFNSGSPATTNPSVNNTSGTAFRSFNPTTDSKRYFPRLSTVKTGATAWQWEAVPNVARSFIFRLTVRDNAPGGGTNNSDDVSITVNGTAGPFVVSAPNTNVTWNAGTTQTVTWDVAGTTANGVNAATVDIFLSTDGGDTYPISLAAGVPNDGSHDIIVPNNQGVQNRVMVKGSNHVFFDISNSDFTIAGQVVCNATVPTGLAASSIGSDTATLSWDAVPGASYDLQYRVVGAGSWTTVPVNGVSTVLTGLTPLTQYEAQVRSRCPDSSTSAYSGTINFTTTDVQLNYCSSSSSNVNDEYISRVQLNTIDNTSGAQFYSDFTGISTTLTKGSQYTITVTPTWTGTVYSEGYSVWIDYNRDGDFNDAGEQVWSQAPTQNTPVSGSFTVPSSAVENSTTMRVSMKYNGIPTSCESFTYGEVEDYTVIIEGSGPDTTPPIITLIGPSTIDLFVGATYNEQGATATDNVDGDITSSIVTTGTVDTNTVGTYFIAYNVSDAAGNAATEVIRTVNVSEAPNGCSGGITAFPYNEGFENTLGAWTQSTADDLDWTVDANGTPSSNTGPSAASEGSYYIYVEASGNGTGYPNKRAIINSPCFDLSGLSQATFSFDYHMYGAADMGTIDLEVSTDDGLSWTSIWNQSGNQGNSWFTVNIDLISYLGSSIILRFNRFVGSTWQADIAIDNVGLVGPPAPDVEAPTAPTNLTASNTTQTSTDLSWAASTDNVGVTGYDVYQGSMVIATVAVTNYQVTGLLPSTSYNFSVVAKDAAGNESASSNVVNVTTLDPPDIQAPTAPTNLIASNTTQTTTDLSWDASTDNVAVTEYDVYRGATLIASVPGLTYQVTGLTPGTSYSFSVRAKDAAGNVSGESNIVNITTDVFVDTTPPSTPANLTASNTTQTTTDLSWTASSDNVGVDSYDVYQGAVVIANVAVTNYQVTGLTPSTSYTFTVVAKDAAGNESTASNAENVTTLDPPDTEAPSAPTNLTASNTTQTTTDLSWTASTDNVGVDSYDVYQGAVVIANVATTNYQVTGLSASTSYNFSVVAKDAAGNESASSNVVNVTTLDTEAPSAPTNLTASNTTQTTTDLSWTASTDNVGVDSYDVYQGAVVIANVAVTNYQVTGLTPSTSYTFTVVAKDAAGNQSTASNAENVTTLDPLDTEAPSAPTNLTASSTTQTSTDLSWTASTDNVGVDSYDVYQGTVVIANVAVTNYQVTGLTPSTSYTFTVVAKDAAGNESASSNVVNVTTLDVSGCSGGITAYPYFEGFENTIGAWTQSTADDLDWTVDANGTPSNNTGPSSAIQGSYYIYVEASGTAGYPNKRAIITSPCFDISALAQPTFNFKYHQYGSTDMGTIDLELTDDDGATWVSIWNSSGNLGNSWQSASVNLSAYSGSSVQLRFNRITGGTWQADIAIDDVSLTDGEIVIPGCSGGITSYPYSEGFENTIGAWTQSSADDLDWTVDANGTPSNNTGPSSAIQGSYYIYVEASGNGTGYPNKRAIITSPCFDLSGQTSATFNFNYHQYGSADMGTIDLEVSDDNGTSWISIWNSSGNLGNSWQSASVDLMAYVGSSIQLRFNRVTGSTWQADIAIDNINLTTAGAARDNDYASNVYDNLWSDIRIFPNPVKGNTLNINSDFRNVNYEIFNALGQLVDKGEVVNNQIDVGKLESAVYRIIFVSEGKTITKRFIKQ